MSIFSRISRVMANYQYTISQIFRDPRSPEFAIIGGAQIKLSDTQNQAENEFMERAILWNTPKKRKSTEKRNLAKYAGANSKSNTNWGTGKFITKNNKIRVDHRTKEFFELGRLAPETYKKVMEETKAIKERVSQAFENGLKPRNQEVSVRYQNEETNEDDIKSGKRIVEMEKERPAFFSANLMQKARTSSESAKSTTVRPTGLG